MRTPPENRWLAETGGIGGPAYAQRFRDLETGGADLHGEARQVDRLTRETTGGAAGRVLEAGCGTGRVAFELARRGHQVTGIDIDPSMLAEARLAAHTNGQGEVRFVQGDLTGLADLVDGLFDVVAAPGNVVVYLTPGTEADVVAQLVGAVRPGGLLVAGFALSRHVSAEQYDGWCRAAGATLVHRWATWDAEPLAGGDYAVMVHRR